jgi:hypothetical protein
MAEARKVNSLDSFAVKLFTYANRQSESHKAGMAAAEKSLAKNLIRASKDAAGSDRILSGVGGPAGFAKRQGSYLGFKFTKERTGTIGWTVIKTGAWQIVDDSVNQGRTKERFVKPDPRRNKRPLPPAKIKRPAMRGRNDGIFTRGTVSAGTGYRYPHWGKAISASRGRTRHAMGRDFQRIGREVFK